MTLEQEFKQMVKNYKYGKNKVVCESCMGILDLKDATFPDVANEDIAWCDYCIKNKETHEPVACCEMPF